MPDLTPFQTVGPYFALLPGLGDGGGPARHPGSGPATGGDGPAIVITGTVRDGGGTPVPDALLEGWHPGLSRVIRAPTDEAGRFEFRIGRPAAAPDDQGALLAPHLVVGVLARGILTRLVTRIYFPDEPATATDPALALVPASRRETLIARRDGPDEYRFDVVLQGPGETVFFDV